MPRNVPLLILDEVVLPTKETEITLAPDELEALDGVGDGLVGLVARPPGATAPTSLERKASPDSPGPLMRACVYGNATILPAGPTEPFARLQLSSLCRGRLEDVRPGQHEPVWFADVSPWPLDGDLPEAPTAKDLKHRFLRLLLATRDPQADPSSLRQQLGRPLGELANTSERVTMLWLLADYLFDQPHPRVALIQAPDASFVVHTIADALELAEAGVPVGPRALAGPLAQTVVSASEDAITMLDDLALIIEAFAPLVVTEDASSRISKQAHEISESARQLSRRVEKTVTSLVKAGKSRNR